MRTKILATLLLGLAVSSRARASTTWNGLGGDGRWDNPANWSAGLPVGGGGSSARTFVDGIGNTILIDAATTAVSSRLLLSDAVGSNNNTINMTGGTLTTTASSSGERNWHLGAQGTATFNLTGGVVNVDGQIRMGVDAVSTAQGILTVDGGTFNATGPIIMGFGTGSTMQQQLNMLSGVLTASQLLVDDAQPTLSGPAALVTMLGGSMTLGDLAIPTNYGANGLNGHFQLDAGTVTISHLSTGGKANSPSGFRLANGPGDGAQSGNIVTGTMDITNGSLLLTGDASALIQSYITSGYLTGFGSPANVIFDFNTTNIGFTTVKATMAGVTDTTWTGSGDGVNWTSAGNWSSGVPTAVLGAHINGAANVQIGVGVNAVAVKLALGEGAATNNATLNVNGGTLNVGTTNTVLIGVKGHGTLNLSNSAAVNTGPLLLGVNDGEANARGTVSVANSTLAVSGGIRMGVGNSTSQLQQLTISGTSNVTTTGLTIGEQAASVAQATVSGGTLAVTGATNLGNGQGTFQINGGNVTTGSLVVAEQAGSVGQVTVSSGTFGVTGSGATSLGGAGNGTMTINGGAVTLGGNLVLGATGGAANAKGTLTVSSGSLSMPGRMLVMGNSVASSEVQTLNMSGGTLVASRLLVNDNEPSPGGPLAVVNMTGGTMALGDLAIPSNWGLNGLNGHFDLHGGVVIVSNASTGGQQNQPSGFRLANGPGAGDQSLNIVTGTMDITSGALILSGDRTALIQGYLTDGVLTGSAGAILYDFNTTNPGFTTVHTAAFSGNLSTNWTGAGDGTNWQVAGNWSNGVPDSFRFANIGGTPTVQVATGVAASASTLAVGYAAGTDNATLNANGGTLSIGGDLSLGTKGRGTLNVTNSSAVTVAGGLLLGVEDNQSNARGIANVNGGTLAVAGAIRMGVGNATAQLQQLTVAGTSTVTAGSLTVGQTLGTVGQVIVSGGTTTISGTSIIGDAGQATLQVSGGAVNLGGTATFGVNSTATVQITGGTVHALGRLRVGGNSSTTAGANANAAATVTINGGSLQVDERLLLGAGKDAVATQTINLISGSLTTGSLLAVADENNSNAVINMTGGTLTTNGPTNLGGAGVGTILLKGGVATLNGNLSMGVDGTATTGKGILTVDGGTLNVPASIIMATSAMTTQVQTINVVSGSLTANRLLVNDNTPGVVPGAVPMAVVNMTGGTMSVGDLAIPTNFGLNGLNGSFQLKGGTVTVTNTSTGGKQNQPSGFRLANGEGDAGNVGNFVKGTMDITTGTLKLAGDALAVINPYIVTDNSLLAFGGTGIVLRDTTTNPGFTTVTAAILGDANRDGVVNIFDINLISAKWNTTGPDADVNGDSIINIFDINAVSAHWLQTNPDGPTVGLAAANAVPEPSTLITLAIGALLLGVRFRGKLRVR